MYICKYYKHVPTLMIDYTCKCLLSVNVEGCVRLCFLKVHVVNHFRTTFCKVSGCERFGMVLLSILYLNP